MEPSAAGLRRPPKKARRTRIQDLSDDSLGIIFAFLDLAEVIRCSVVCSSWRKVIHRRYQQQQKNDPDDNSQISLPTGSFSEHFERLAMLTHRFALVDGPAKVFQWRGHSVGVNQCRMKMGHFLTGVGDKVVGLVGTRICIWSRTETRSILSSRDALFPKGLCMRYVDPEAVIGCEDGKVRIFDMYSRKVTQIIKMHDAPVTCLSFSDDQLLFTGSSQGRSIALLDLSSGQQVSLRGSTYASVGIKTLCFNPGSNYLFAGSTAGHACCWDLRKQDRTLWEERVSPNVLYSMHHLRNDKSTLVIGGIDGVLRAVDQDSGEVIATHIMEESSSSSSSASRPSDRNVTVRKVKKLSSSDDRIDLMSKACRPRITCLAVGMRKVVTTHNDNCIRVWKFE